jgi:hypothetical protein
VDIISRFDTMTLENAIQLFIRLDKIHRIRVFSIMNGVNDSKKSFMVNTFVDMRLIHVIRSIEIIEEDIRILDKSITYASRIGRHLEKDDFISTLERSVNTSARVDRETRYKGLDILNNDIRAVASRRLLKQIDGQKQVYSDNTIEQIVSDYDTVINKKVFVNILTSSTGIIHGFYRQQDKYVTQERKLEVVDKFYNGNLNHKKVEMLKFYDNNTPTVIHKIEYDFVIDPPRDLRDPKKDLLDSLKMIVK